MEPVIILNKYVLRKLNYTSIDRGNKEVEHEEENLIRRVTTGITEDKKNAIVILNVKVKDIELGRYIECEVLGEFSINDNIDESNIENTLGINGVALIYPYVRTIISIISTLDSEKAILIPTINTNIYKESSREDESED